MTREEANQIIETALRKIGVPEAGDEAYFLDERFDAIPWLPAYTWRVGGRIWGVELCRGDRLPESTIRAMADMAAIDNAVQTAFFVPDGEPFEHLIPACRDRGIALVAKTSDEYETLLFGGGAAQVAPFVIRIPDWVVESLPRLENLNQGFRNALNAFSRRYRRLLDSGNATDANQEGLLRGTFVSLLSSDGRFSAEYIPLEMLRLFEHNRPPNRGRDHYFHTFNNFLLGCLVIDRTYDLLLQFREDCFPGIRDWSIEYTWLLTVLFHDVGYPIQKHEETSEMIFGVPVQSKEEAIAERKKAWESPVYRLSRTQLISLYDHLTQAAIQDPWVADPFPVPDHSLDKAFEQSFLEQGHGVASCMRMLAYFFRTPPRQARQRQFLASHIFAAGLSIPFHDYPVRKLLRENGITRIRTSRFPFAGLLMFIDSIQEDRRGATQAPDLLTGITVNNHSIVAELNLTLLTPDKLGEKKREVVDVKGFLEEDSLTFEYPADLLG
jgi:hypothetical protein